MKIFVIVFDFMERKHLRNKNKCLEIMRRKMRKEKRNDLKRQRDGSNKGQIAGAASQRGQALRGQDQVPPHLGTSLSPHTHNVASPEFWMDASICRERGGLYTTML
jgi:hypothetical protein